MKVPRLISLRERIIDEEMFRSFDEVSLNSETQYLYIQKREMLSQTDLCPENFLNKVFFEKERNLTET